MRVFDDVTFSILLSIFWITRKNRMFSIVKLLPLPLLLLRCNGEWFLFSLALHDLLPCVVLLSFLLFSLNSVIQSCSIVIVPFIYVLYPQPISVQGSCIYLAIFIYIWIKLKNECTTWIQAVNTLMRQGVLTTNLYVTSLSENGILSVWCRFFFIPFSA